MTDEPTTFEEPSFHADDYERKWIGATMILLVAFAATVAVAGFALGFQVPGQESRVDPRTVTDSGPFSQPGLRDLGSGEYEVYMVAQQYLFTPREIRVPAGSTVTFYVTSVDVQHGFKLQDTNVNLMIVPGHVSKLTAEFDEPGEYPYICHEYCGIAHAAMFGSLIVEGGA